MASEDGSILQYPILEQGNAEVDPEDFVGTVTPPDQRFRAYVRGKDVLLDIPADTPGETPVYLTLTATNDADTGQTNSAMVSRLAQAASPELPVTVPASGGGGGGCYIAVVQF